MPAVNRCVRLRHCFGETSLALDIGRRLLQAGQALLSELLEFIGRERRLSEDLGGEAEAYQEVARRLGLLPDGEDGAVLDLESHRKRRGKPS